MMRFGAKRCPDGRLEFENGVAYEISHVFGAWLGGWGILLFRADRASAAP
jgi:hypothetical protein